MGKFVEYSDVVGSNHEEVVDAADHDCEKKDTTNEEHKEKERNDEE